jgi:hypothetical protein
LDDDRQVSMTSLVERDGMASSGLAIGCHRGLAAVVVLCPARTSADRIFSR